MLQIVLSQLVIRNSNEFDYLALLSYTLNSQPFDSNTS